MSASRLLVVLAAVLLLTGGARTQSGPLLVLVGTYTGETSKGIYAFRFDPASGHLAPLGLAAASPSPSFLALHPSGRFVYAVNEVDDGPEKSGTVSAFAIDGTTGQLTPLNTQLSRGANPCHLSVDRTGRFLLVANYTGGNLAVLPIQADGRLGPSVQVVQHTGRSVNRKRQQQPHAHYVALDANNRFAVAADLGADRLFVYRFDASTGRLTPNDPPSAPAAPGAGPRHFAFHPQRPVGFAINELSSTITTYAWDAARGALTPGPSVPTLPQGANDGSFTAGIEVHPDGRFVYGSNRGHDSIAAFEIQPESGQLTMIETEPTRGRAPRHFALDPSGRWLIAANQRSDTLAVFRVDAGSGALSAEGDLVAAPSPVCVLFVP